MKIELRTRGTLGHLFTVHIDGVEVGIGPKESCLPLIKELRASVRKSRLLKSFFIAKRKRICGRKKQKGIK